VLVLMLGTDMRCVFCKNGSGDTQDHCPPRSFFQEKLPDSINLVTAPCCRACHDVSKKNDSTLRNLFISFQDTENPPSVLSGLAAKRDRSFYRDGTEVSRIASMMTPVEVRSQGGIYLKDDTAFDLDTPAVHAFIERVCRALLWWEYRITFFLGTFDWRLNVDMPDLVYRSMLQVGRLRKVHDEFAYGILNGNLKTPDWVILNFYGATEAFVRIERMPSRIDGPNPYAFGK
jgi:hypothetical protein